MKPPAVPPSLSVIVRSGRGAATRALYASPARIRRNGSTHEFIFVLDGRVGRASLAGDAAARRR